MRRSTSFVRTLPAIAASNARRDEATNGETPGRGLRSRIIWTTALVTALAMAVMIGAVILVLNAVTRINVDSKLEDRLVVLSPSIAGDQDGLAHALESPADRIEDSTWLFHSEGQQSCGLEPESGSRPSPATWAKPRGRPP
jgi:hypothetical protein